MSISAMLAAIVEAFKAPLTGVKVFPYEGQFTERDLARVSNDAPAVYVSCVGISDAEDDGNDIIGTGQWVASIVTKRDRNVQSKASRFDAAVLIAEAMLPVISGSNGTDGAWADESEGAPLRIRARNLFSPELDARALTLWVVTWEQPVSLVAFDTDALDDLFRLNGEGDLDTDTTYDIATVVAGAP